jgi:hypothetical protein
LQPATVIALEQVAQDRAAGLDIGLDADELRPLVGGADRPLGQHPADRVGLLVVGGPQPLERLLVALMVARDGEGHELVERHAVLGIDVEQRRRDRRELQALLHHVDRDEERGGDLFLGLAFLRHRQERLELVERCNGARWTFSASESSSAMPLSRATQGTGAVLARRFRFTSSSNAR